LLSIEFLSFCFRWDDVVGEEGAEDDKDNDGDDNGDEDVDETGDNRVRIELFFCLDGVSGVVFLSSDLSINSRNVFVNEEDGIEEEDDDDVEDVVIGD